MILSRCAAHLAIYLAVGSFASFAGYDADALDEALYARILKEHTVAVDDIASTRVDYAALRDSKEWEDLLSTLSRFDPSRLDSPSEKLAFWINTYNILAIDLVRRNYPIDSIRSIGSLLFPVWKRPAGEVGGRRYTLDEIEKKILVPMGDPRIHGAIVCASISCPPLRREPYRGSEVEKQLDDNVRRWLADPRKGVRIDSATKTVFLSRIFDFFPEDFGDDPLAFVQKHLAPGDAAWLAENRASVRIRHFDYDWGVNAVATGASR